MLEMSVLKENIKGNVVCMSSKQGGQPCESLLSAFAWHWHMLTEYRMCNSIIYGREMGVTVYLKAAVHK